MLADFFKLNEPYKTLGSVDDFVRAVEQSEEIKDVELSFSELQIVRPRNKIERKRFQNVSFSKKVITGINFQDCEFEDCLFIGTDLEKCEFHNCTFKNCNPFKIRIEDTYLDPKCFEGMLDPRKYANIGVHLFDRLLYNSRKIGFTDFVAAADFNFRKWKRFNLIYGERSKRLSGRARWTRVALDFIYWLTAGYGWKLWRFFLSSMAFFLLVVLWNYEMWDRFHFANDDITTSATLPHVVYATVMIVSTLGIGGTNPQTTLGVAAIAVEAIVGPIWVSILAALLIKKMIR